MKIMSFNTQHCLNYRTGSIDFEVMAEAIKSTDADVVGLNEMRGAGTSPEYTAQVDRLAALTGMPYYAFTPAIMVENGGPYGNGILSRIPILSVEAIPIPLPDNRLCDNDLYEARVILKAELEGGVTVLITHFGLNSDERDAAVAAVTASICDQKCILMGDFNVTPDNAILDPIKARLRDTATVFPTPLFSFPSDVPTCKIDYIFVSPDAKILKADIPPIVASDHRPHVAEVTFA